MLRAFLLPVLAVLVAPASAQLEAPPVPDGNPVTAEKALLGKALFWDEQLSSTRTRACGSCHMPRYGGSDGFAALTWLSAHPGLDGLWATEDDRFGSPGVIRSLADGTYTPSTMFGLRQQVTERIAPSAINAAYYDELFWDGSSGASLEDPLTGAVLLAAGAALESQALSPPVDDVEMGHVGIEWADVAARVVASAPLFLATDLPAELDAFVAGKSYPELFEQAFGSADVTPARIAMAIATYERTLISDQAPVDVGSLNESQSLGKQVFEGKGGCVQCHSAPAGVGQLFSDRDYHNTGVRPVAEDLGRQLVTGDPADAGKFRTPSLRNVSLRPRFFHNGQYESLTQVVEFYDRGGDFAENLDPAMQPLELTPEEKDALIAYLESFTDPRVENELAPFDRPELYRGSEREPLIFGVCAIGSGGTTPEAIAVEPPYVKNPNLTFGVTDTVGGAPAFLSISLGAFTFGAEVLGVELYVDPLQEVVLEYVQLQGAPGVAGAGYGSIVFPLDLPPSFIGVDLYQQWMIIEPGGPQGLVTTPGVSLTLF
ncbi:MAG: cytochrome c peroxidase [Planctomycetota bacterium]